MAGFSPSMREQDFSVPNLAPPAMEIAEEKRSKRNPRQLDFEGAMADFRTMFPGLDVELIESVLRANGGAVDDTIDQLLTITVDCAEPSRDPKSSVASPPLLPPKPAGSLRSSNERLQNIEDSTPALPPREGSLKRNKSKTKPLSSTATLYNTPRTRYDTEWNGLIIPMIGKLPSDFLRMMSIDSPPPRPPKVQISKQRSQSLKLKNRIPTHLAEQTVTKSRAMTLHHSRPPAISQTHKSRHGHMTASVGERLSSNALKRQIEANQRRLQETCDSTDLDGDTERFLEDERLALIMQNEEFLRELKRNDDFMRTLEFERDMLATRLALEQKKNRQLLQLSSPSAAERSPPNWMVPRASEIDENSLPRSVSPSSETASMKEPTTPDHSLDSSEQLSPSIVPVDRTDKTDVHDFRDQLKSMGATSKKKFALLAKKFFTTSRKKRKGSGKIIRDAHGPSTLNLLDDNDDEDLIDVSSCPHGSTDAVLFEPLPDAWTSDNLNEFQESEPRADVTREHFL